MPAHEPERPGGDVSIDLWRGYEDKPTFKDQSGRYEVVLSKDADEALNHPNYIRVIANS